MANIKSAKKRVKQTRVRTLRNKIRKTMFRTAIRRFEDALKSNDLDRAETTLRIAYGRLDRAAQKGAIHRNTAARRKSRLTAKLNHLRSQAG